MDKRYLLPVVIVLPTLLAGCGTDMPQTVRVNGVVTFDGGPCPNAGSLYFHPMQGAEGFPTRAGYGEFGKDGKFEVRTYTKGDGLLPGKYQVQVTCWERPPTPREEKGKSHIPADYLERNPQAFEVEIQPGEKLTDLTIDVATK